MQIVGPRGSEIIPFRGLKTARQTLSLPIPKSIDKEGGTFEVELGEQTLTIRMNHHSHTRDSERGRRLWLQTYSIGTWYRCQRSPSAGKLFTAL